MYLALPLSKQIEEECLLVEKALIQIEEECLLVEKALIHIGRGRIILLASEAV
jgi:hypothetical protein